MNPNSDEMPVLAPASRRPHSRRAVLASLALGLLAVAAPWGGSLRAEPPPQLAVIVNPGVPADALGKAALASIFTRANRTWKDGSPIRALNLLPQSPERIEFDRVVLRMEPEQSAQYWIDRQVRGEEPAPKAIAKAETLVRLIQTLPGSIGFVPEGKVDAKVRVVAWIRDGKVVAP
jgi:hypothetical protein